VVRVGEGGTPVASDSVRAGHLKGLQADLPRLVAMRDEARRHGGRLLIVLWPKDDYVRVPEVERGLGQELTITLETFSREHGIDFVSMQPAMQKISDKTRLTIPDDWHPTAFTHCVVASQLTTRLSELGFRLRSTPCQES
jgi:hypothetical protein